MAYERHDPTGHLGYEGSGYDNGLPFLEEDENNYNSAKYDSKDDPLKGGYRSNEENDENKRELSEFEKQVEEEQKPKYDDKEGDEKLQKKAADELRMDDNAEDGREKKNKNISSIEQAIEKAIKEEKEVVVLDR
jgi:hypothetical protein